MSVVGSGVMTEVSSSRDAGLAVPIFFSVERDGGARVQEETLWNLGGAQPAIYLSLPH